MTTDRTVDTFVVGFPFGDASSDLANNRLQFIEFYHIPSGRTVQFKAFLTQFSDQYASEWNDEDAFGRMDPISTFKRTKRTITLGWDVVSAGIEESVLNMERCSLLLSMLYPDYEGIDGGASRIKTAPLFKIRFMNLIQNVAQPGMNAKEGGLLGKVSGFSYEPDLEQGFFDSMNLPTEAIKIASFLPRNTNGSLSESELIFPQTIKLQCEFTVLHQHALGWENQKPRGDGFSKFPYAGPRVQFFGPPRLEKKIPPNTDDNSSAEDRKKKQIAERLLRKTIRGNIFD